MTNVVIQNINNGFITTIKVPKLFRYITCTDILYNFRLGCTQFLQRIFADSYGSASQLFISTCFQLEKLFVWLGNSRCGIRGPKIPVSRHTSKYKAKCKEILGELLLGALKELLVDFRAPCELGAPREFLGEIIGNS